jgi:hypothetical protein
MPQRFQLKLHCAFFQVKTEDILSLSRYGFDRLNLEATNQLLQDLDTLACALPTDEVKTIHQESLKALDKIWESLHARAVAAMANSVQEKGLALLDDLEKLWFSKVDVHETALQVQKDGVAWITQQLQAVPEYAGLWEKYLQPTTCDSHQVKHDIAFLSILFNSNN